LFTANAKGYCSPKFWREPVALQAVLAAAASNAEAQHQHVHPAGMRAAGGKLPFTNHHHLAAKVSLQQSAAGLRKLSGLSAAEHERRDGRRSKTTGCKEHGSSPAGSHSG
jgi:hypothetical protein